MHNFILLHHVDAFRLSIKHRHINLHPELSFYQEFCGKNGVSTAFVRHETKLAWTYLCMIVKMAIISLIVLKTRDLISIESSFINLSFAFIHSSQVVSKVPNTLDGFFLQILENFRKQNTSNFRDTLRVLLIFLTTQSSVGLGATKVHSLINWTICHVTTNLWVCVLKFFVRRQQLHAILIPNFSFTFLIS